MAEAQSALEVLRGTEATPIAQLRPDIEDASSRVVDGVVTITWPYSIVTKSMAFILAEHDFRLRRERGQLRIELHGAAAQALASSSIGGGDEVRVSLDGAVWEEHQAATRLPAGTLAWQYTFSNRLLLHVRRAQDQGSDFIQVDAPHDQEPPPEPNSPQPDRLTPSPPDALSRPDQAMPLTIPEVVATPNSTLPAKRPASSMFSPGEYASPAFLKRARVSYGSLFEGGLDIFEEEKDPKAKEKRRPRFSMQNTAWRYTSRSPSPDADKPSDLENDGGDKSGRDEEAQAPANTPKPSPPRPLMVDEACQTHEVYLGPSRMEVQALAESGTHSMLQPPSASQAQHQGHHVGFQTPSRTLFDRRHDQRDLLRTADEPDMAYEAAGLRSNDFGVEAEQHVGSANTLDAPPVAASATSKAPFTEGIAAQGYPPAAFNGNHVDAAALNIDPVLQFPGTIPAPDHMYFGAPPPGHAEWHAEPLAARLPWAPVQADAQPSTAAVVDPSPVRRQPHSAGSGSRDPEGSEPNPNIDPNLSEGASEGDFTGGDREAGTTERDDAAGGDGDASDLPGEDYDLRNYDRARDDDDEGDFQEESEPNGSTEKQQALDLSEEDEDELHGQAPETEPYNRPVHGAEGMHRDLEDGENADYLSSDDDDDEEAGYSDEEDEYGYLYNEGYGDEEEEDEESGEYVGAFYAPPRPTAPQEPVFISLLSDSEDETEPQPVPGPPGIPPLPVGESIPIHGTVERISSEVDDDAEASRDEESSGYSSPEVVENEAWEQDAPAQQGVGTEPPASQSAQSAVLEAAEDSDEATSENANVHDDSEMEEGPQPENGEQHQDSGFNDVEPIGLAVADTLSSEPMDVGAPLGEDPQPQTDEPETMLQDQPMHGEPTDTLLEHQETAVEVFESRSSGPQAMEFEEQALTEASDSPMRDALPAKEEEHRQPGLRIANADVMSVVTEVEEADRESGTHPEASEDLAALKAPEATMSGGEAQRLPTPQPKENAVAPVDVENEALEEDGDDVAAQTQIMAEHQEYRTPGKQNASPPKPSEARDEARDEAQVDGDDQEPEVLIRVKSLRSRAHRMTRSRDADSESQEDPSVLLAKASATHPSGTKAGTEPKSPRRLRVASNSGDASDPSLALAKASASEPKDDQFPTRSQVASGKVDETTKAMAPVGASSWSPRGKRRHATPEVTRELRSKPHDAARRSTPETVVAETVLESPSVAGSVDDDDMAAMKRNLQRTLRTALPDYLPLRSLRSCLNKTIDMLAVSTLTPPQPHRPKHGPRDYMLELILTDPSTAPTTVIVAHLFRPHQASLPVVRAGDVVLLRRMQVVSVKGRGFGARAGDASAWAVFERDDADMLAQIKGPPVEVTDGEVEYAQGLKRWWAMQGQGALARVDKATQKASQANKADAR